MRLGAHLPLADLGDGSPTADGLVTYTTTARDLGYSTMAANDHLLWSRPWLDGPTALASIVSAAGPMTVATSLALPVVRHPVVVAKMLTALGCLAEGSVVGGLGPGSSQADYGSVGIAFEQRWARFDEAFRLVRALVRGEPAPPASYYPVADRLLPLPDAAPQVWFGSWGSDRRLAAMATVADGWFASAYNATPRQFRATRDRLNDHLRAVGRDPAEVPDAVATTWFFVTDRPGEAERVLADVLAPALNRDPAQLTHLPVGSAQHCAEILAGYAAAGAREVLLWPVRDAVRQLEHGMAALASSQ